MPAQLDAPSNPQAAVCSYAATLMGQLSIPHFEPGILKVDKQ